VCNTSTGKCVAAPSATDGGTFVPLCDAASCRNGACEARGGACGALYDGDFGCIPSCSDDDDCAKGYACRFAVVVTSSNRCTHGSNSCGQGRTCSATLESPQGVCSCTSDAECPSSATCYTYSSGQKYCRTRTGACYPRYECAQLRTSEELVCNDRF
jgi:hypothetical protein